MIKYLIREEGREPRVFEAGSVDNAIRYAAEVTTNDYTLEYYTGKDRWIRIR